MCPTEVDRGRSKSKLPCLTRPLATLRFIGPLMLVLGLPCSRFELWLSLPLSFSDVGTGVAIPKPVSLSTLRSLSFPFLPPNTFEFASTANGDDLPDVLVSCLRGRSPSSTVSLLDFSIPGPIFGVDEARMGTSGTDPKRCRDWGDTIVTNFALVTTVSIPNPESGSEMSKLGWDR